MNLGMTIRTTLWASAALSCILFTAPLRADDAAPPPQQPQARLPLDELRIFVEAFDRVSSSYVEKVDDRTLLENAIKGMLAGLDPHSSFLDRESFSELQESTTGNYGGLGIEVGLQDGFIKVISPMDDTPAARAGIMPGDLIIQLDDKPVKGMSLDEAIEEMRGEPGSHVHLTVVREGEPIPLEMDLVREVIQVSSVRHEFLEPGYGYVRVAQFQNNTAADVTKALKALSAEQELSGLVLDLRNNPGGVLQSAVEVSDLFIDEGLIVYTDGRIPSADLRFNAATPDTTNGLPLVVLVNEGTASASEIVAGALQDHGRAIILGTNTFGKGSVQTILPLNESKAIKLTTALYYTPNGRSIQAEGIKPDIWVGRSTVTPVKASGMRVKEKDLRKHLQNGNHDADQEDAGAHEEEDFASTDYQLNEALIVLKGLNIMAAKKKEEKGG